MRENTDIPHEIILVDNGSSDNSPAVLGAEPGVNLITLPKNVGFAAGNNCGVAQAKGPLLCLLNSDVFVTYGWIRKLLKCMRRTDADMVGPCTNNSKGKQRYGMRIHGLFPDPFRRTERVDYLSFFCVLMRIDLYQKLNGLDERFGLGMFEDDDFCRRAREIGSRLIIDGRTWVWHEGHATMTANGCSHDELIRKNRDVFAAKWGD